MPENIPALDAQAITLREHLEGRIAALAAHLADAVRSVEESSVERQDGLRREIHLVQQSTKEAVDKAEEAQHLRNEAQNEWRQTVTNLISRYAEQRQIEAMESALRSKIEAVEKGLEAELEGRVSAASEQTIRVEERLRELERNVATRDMLEATIKARTDALASLSDRITRLEKFMWVLMGAFILLQIIAPYLRTIAATKP